MAYIRVDLDELSVAIKKLEQQIVNAEQKKREIENKISTLDNSWEGSDAETMHQIVSKQLEHKKMKNVIRGLENTRNRLKDVSKAYQNACNNAISLAKKL